MLDSTFSEHCKENALQKSTKPKDFASHFTTDYSSRNQFNSRLADLLLKSIHFLKKNSQGKQILSFKSNSVKRGGAYFLIRGIHRGGLSIYLNTLRGMDSPSGQATQSNLFCLLSKKGVYSKTKEFAPKLFLLKKTPWEQILSF